GRQRGAPAGAATARPPHEPPRAPPPLGFGPGQEEPPGAAPEAQAPAMEGHGPQGSDDECHEPLDTDQRDGHADVAGTREQGDQQRHVGPPGQLRGGRRERGHEPHGLSILELRPHLLGELGHDARQYRRECPGTEEGGERKLEAEATPLEPERVRLLRQAIEGRPGNPSPPPARSERRHLHVVEVKPPEPTEGRWHATRGGPADREENDGRARRPERVARQLPAEERETEPGDPTENDPGSRCRERDPERTLHVRRRGGRRLHALTVSAEPAGFLSESTSWFPGGAVLRQPEWPRKLPSGGLSSRIRAGS